MKKRVLIQSVEHARLASFTPMTIMLNGRVRHLIAQISLPAAHAALVLVLLTWAFTDRSLATPVAPPGAPLVLAGMTFGVAGFVRWFRDRFGVATTTVQALPDPLPDPLFALYLAIVILTGIPAALTIAAVAPLLVNTPGIVRHPARLREALRQSAEAAVITFVTGVTYMPVGGALALRVAALQGHIVRVMVASLVMLLAITGLRALGQVTRGVPLTAAWMAYWQSPAFRFQVLLLSVGPLLPLAEVLDDIEAELAWLLFLVPLCAIYYLALVSVRLQQQTGELQATVEQLQASQRRAAELTDYAALVTTAQEDERKRLARELHDDTAQALIALSRGLEALAARHAEPPLSASDTRFMNELGELAKRTLDGVRRACQDLRPSVLDDLGLAAALESLVHTVSQRGLTCSFHCDGTDGSESDTPACPPEVDVAIYRIAQEALSNAQRHAHAQAANVALMYQSAGIRLRIEDDGVGFATDHLLTTQSAMMDRDGQEREPLSGQGGQGLVGMRERAGLIGAQLHVRSTPRHGTVVELVVPVNLQRH